MNTKEKEKNMKEMETKIVEAFNGMVEAGKLEEMIAKQLEATIGNIINEALRSHSDFGKSLKERITQALQVDMDDLQLAGYNQIVLKIIKQKLDEQIEGKAAASLSEQLGEIFSEAPEKIRLSELCEKFIAHIKDNAYGPLESDEISLVVKWSEASVSGYCHIGLDERYGRGLYECKYQLDINPKGEVYGLKVDQDRSEKLFFGKQFGFGQFLFQLHAAGTTLTIDEDDCVTDIIEYD